MRRNWTIILFACQSFAWFTSKDEVTNRLSASADYDVSIIENFAPPKQWVPGQTVTKEEAVVNTGSIDAFVKQTISGVMTVTVPIPTDVKPEGTAEDYITLNEKEVGTLEAGSYLAWAPEGSARVKGEKVVYAMDTADPKAPLGDFVPDVEGLYVFRRAVVKGNEEDPSKDTSYDYVGYYYVPGTTGTYYKLHNDTLVVSPTTIGENGDLSAEPTYRFSKKVTKTLNKVPMTYNAEKSRLEIEYSANSSTDTSALYALDREIYDALRKKLDYDIGKTKWANSTTPDSFAAGNSTGLTTYDNLYDYSVDYASEEAAEAAEVADKTVDTTDYTNFSLSRLTSAYNEQATAVKKASPPNNGTGTADADWSTPYGKATTQRGLINKGIISAGKLDTLLWEICDEIGGPSVVASTAAVTTWPYGLVMVTTAGTNAADTHEWNSRLVEESLNEPTVTYTGTAVIADTLDEAAFADEGFSETPYNCTTPDVATDGFDFGSKVSFSVSAAPYVAGTESTFQETWDEIVLLKKRIALLDQKITACSTAASVPVTTNVGRQDVEANQYKAMLTDQKTALEKLLGDSTNPAEGTARYRFQHLVTDITSKIETLNSYQSDVDTANAQYYTYYSATNGEPAAPAEGTYSTPAGVPDGPVTVADGDTAHTANTNTTAATLVVNGTQDAPDEDTLEKNLKDVYGVAYKDTLPQASYADGTTYALNATYSPDQTKGRIDNSVTANTEADPEKDSTNGIIGWTTSSNDNYATVENGDKDSIDDSPYYKLLKVGFMKEKRTNDVAELDDIYEDLKTERHIVDIDNGASAPVKVYVNLANIGGGEEKDKWQRVSEETTGKDFDFYYTGILQSGETSSLLIKSVEFAPEVEQDSFLDLDLDLNVALQSAQAVYQGDEIILPTAANSTIIGAKTTAETYGIEDAVKWTADSTEKSLPSENDPNPKAYNVAPQTAGGEGGTGTGGETPATTNVDVTVAGADEAHNLIKMVKTGTGDTATWAVADSGSTITNAASGYHYTVNGEGSYRTVDGLTYALNAVTGDNTPVVEYVAD